MRTLKTARISRFIVQRACCPHYNCVLLRILLVLKIKRFDIDTKTKLVIAVILLV